MNDARPLRIATRGSDLALWQARHVADRLAAIRRERPEIVVVKTVGDRITDRPLTPELGRGFFTKDIEEGLLDGRWDLAVHSLKDLATDMPPGLCLAAVLSREEAGELLLVRPEAHDPEAGSLLPLRSGVRVGTSSPRRAKFLLHRRSDLHIEMLRGNVPTRVRKLQEGDYDAIVVAIAGVRRLGLELHGLVPVPLGAGDLPGAPGQAALAIQARVNDIPLLELVHQLEDEITAVTTGVERDLLAALGGGCSLPFGAYCEPCEAGLRLRAFLFHPEAAVPLRVDLEGRTPDALVHEAASRLRPALDQPLRGLRLAVLRGRSGTRIEEDLRAAGAEVQPLACYVPVEQSLAEADLEWICAADAVLCSSRNAVSALARNLEDQACALREDVLLVVPGVTTVEAARRWFPDHEVRLGVPPRASGMGAVAVEHGARRIASVGAEGGSTDGVRVAEEAGCEAHHFAAYQNRVLDVGDDLAQLPDDVVPFYLAPPAVTACPPSRFVSRRPPVAMGPTTAEALGGQALITPTPDLLGLLAVLPGLGRGNDDSGGT